MTLITEEERTIVVRLSSSIRIHNKTSIPFKISFLGEKEVHDVGLCRENKKQGSGSIGQKTTVISKGKFAKPSRNFGIPVDRLDNFTNEWRNEGRSQLFLSVSPVLFHTQNQYHGTIEIQPIRNNFLKSTGSRMTTNNYVVCQNEDNHYDSFFLQAT